MRNVYVVVIRTTARIFRKVNVHPSD